MKREKKEKKVKAQALREETERTRNTKMNYRLTKFNPFQDRGICSPVAKGRAYLQNGLQFGVSAV